MIRIESLFQLAKVFYETGDPSHDVLHIRRVMKTCEVLAIEEKADLEIVLAAAILHDIVNLPKNHPERLQASQLAADKSKTFLQESGFNEKKIAHISQVILEHSFSLGKKPSSIESAILQDADKLDALGAIGIMRTISCGARMGCSYYHAAEPWAETRELDDKQFTLDHFYMKLLKLKDLMNTAAAKKLADERTAFMQNFIAQLKSELHVPSPS
jgi:uncharacterized protein